MKSKNPVLNFIFSLKMLVIVIIIAAAAGGGFWWYKGRKTDDIGYKTTRALRSDLSSIVSATGTVEPTETVDVGTQISGTISDLYVDYNSVVEKGQLIARMDSSTQQTEMSQAAANLQSAQADLGNYQAVLVKAKSDYRRTKQLIDKDLIAKSELDSAVSSLATSSANVNAAKAKIAQYKAALAKTKITFGYTYIYAPVDGVVVSKNVEKGQTVAASYSTPSIVEIARDLTKMQVEINIDEADIGGIKNGQTAEFTVDSYPARKFKGKVTQIRLSPSSTDNVVTYTVIAEVDNKDKLLLPGMTANVSIVVQGRENVIVVPNSAFRFEPATVDTENADQGGPGGPGGGHKANVAKAKAPAVYLLENKRPVKRLVKKGITDGENTEVISGLNEGDNVITGIDVGGSDTGGSSKKRH